MAVPPERIRGEVLYVYDRPSKGPASFRASLLHVDPRTMVVAHRTPSTANAVHHFGEEVVGPGYLSVWFLFKGEPYDIARFYRPDGTFTGYYVDVLEGTSWEGQDPETLQTMVDLYLDLWITPDFRYAVLDEDELEEALQKGDITAEQGRFARQVLDSLVARVKQVNFPPLAVREFQL